MELLKPDGTLAKGVMGLYQHAQGHFLFTEADPVDKRDPEHYVFDGAKTLIVQMRPGKVPGTLDYNVAPVNRGPFQPTVTKVPKGLIIGIQDTTDAAFLKLARATLAGVVMPQGPMPEPRKPERMN